MFGAFFIAYLGCALWSSTDDDGMPLDDVFDFDDIAPECMATMRADCQDFYNAHFEDISADVSQAGHDFWLTRNGHGAGFWDGDWPDSVGYRLTKAAHAYGDCTLYVGDDGRLYCM